MASLELGKLPCYNLILSEGFNDIFYAKLTDSLYKTLEDYHHNKHKGQINLTVNKQGRGGSIQVVKEQNVSKHSFKCLPISNKTGLDCLKQTRSNADLTVVGTAHTRLVIQATEDVYQTTRQKLILAEEKNNENQTVMIDFKNKRKLQSKKTSDISKKPTEIALPTSTKISSSSSSKTSQKTVPTFKNSILTVTDTKAQQKLRERAIHILALRPHRKLELLHKLSDGNKSKDAITKILAQVSNTQNNMFHLKSFLYGEVQVDTWADYSVSDRAAIRQQMQLHGHGSQSETTTTDQQSKEPAKPPPTATKPANNNPTKENTMPAANREPVKQAHHASTPGNKMERTRKRSSSEDNKTAKKVCRDTDRSSDEAGINVNAVCRRAAEELRLPFMDAVKKEIARIQQDFVKITTAQQKTSYAAEFERDYEEYVRLKKREREIGAQFEVLRTNYDKVSDKRCAEVKSINRKARDLFKQYVNNSNWCRDKERLMKLEAKLSHIKQLFKSCEDGLGSGVI
ncbi:hypothetical protein ACHWQZ_G003953 [Mnemiopsis leidyi]